MVKYLKIAGRYSTWISVLSYFVPLCDSSGLGWSLNVPNPHPHSSSVHELCSCYVIIFMKLSFVLSEWRNCWNNMYSCLSLQVLTVADLGLNLSQNFTIRWMWWIRWFLIIGFICCWLFKSQAGKQCKL